MSSRSKGATSYFFSFASWIADKRYGDTIYRWLDDVAGAAMSGVLQFLWTYGVPFGFFTLGSYFLWRTPRAAPAITSDPRVVDGPEVTNWLEWDALPKLTLIQWASLLQDRVPADINRFKPNAADFIPVGNTTLYPKFKMLKEACYHNGLPYKILVERCTPLWEITRSDLIDYYNKSNRQADAPQYPKALFKDQRTTIGRLRRKVSPRS